MADETPQKSAPKATGKQENAVSSSNDQLAFLVACIKNSDKGKIDFQKVADGCNIVSKGAAAKRYERLMKAHGLHSTQSSSASPGPSTPKKKPSKKRKNQEDSDDAANSNSDNDTPKKTTPKSKKVKVKKEADIKAEPGDQPDTGELDSN